MFWNIKIHLIRSVITTGIKEIKMKLFQYATFTLGGFLLMFCWQSHAQSLQVTVLDSKQKPIEFAVIYINEVLPKISDHSIVIDQVDKEFIPYVTVVQRGSAINFPNNDDIRHQVYSFSKSKQFELPLYSGDPSAPVVFDKSGVVAMACNIHDWMKAYVFVVDTNKFSISNKAGKAVLTDLAKGQYEVVVWHPKSKGSEQLNAKQIEINEDEQKLVFTVRQKTQFKAWRSPKSVKRRGY